MRIITFDDIRSLAISPEVWYQWVHEVFVRKYECVLPCKISMKQEGNVFVNVMPAIIPYENRYGVKVVSRYPASEPALVSNIMLYNKEDGMPLALMDGTWITAARTGAVAALAIMTLKKKGTYRYGFIGLGNTARATLMCLLSQLNGKNIEVNLMEYKNHADLFMERFAEYENVTFKRYNSVVELILDSDVVVSCVTFADSIFAPDEAFTEGVLVVPVHTRGFQNCDLFFDTVVTDDIRHIHDFRYFSQFKRVCELSEILSGKVEGRVSDADRILVYDIGIALNDIYFASKIYDMLGESAMQVSLNQPDSKFWI